MRAMVLADVDAVLAIELAVQAYPWTRGNFIDALNCGYVCRVDAGEIMPGHPEEAGEIRGYAILMPVVDEAELLNIGVAATWQRKGVGRAILNEILEAARKKNMRRVFLEVRPSNTAAIALYRSAGFGEIGVRRGYYRNTGGGEDAVTMACELMGEPNG
ncbi:MAG: ribosomal-protein-alanine N-acetyltransferase [Gallionella sp.]|nr:MAG: ribosomal-protein-alanine N-acetyltransferase [Gallionella sp.]